MRRLCPRTETRCRRPAKGEPLARANSRTPFANSRACERWVKFRVKFLAAREFFKRGRLGLTHGVLASRAAQNIA